MALAFKVVIPARYGSTRLPGKPLRLIAGKTMIEHVCRRALEADAEQVVVATDDVRIFKQVKKFGVAAMMTNIKHNNGTERIVEVAQHYNWQDSDIIVNLQGDEPLMSPKHIRVVAQTLSEQATISVATLAMPIHNLEELFNQNVVKVVLNKNAHAMYFSRAVIPWNRNNFTNANGRQIGKTQFLKHIGIYAYMAGFLKRYHVQEKSPLESIESLEQLRMLWHGYAIAVTTVTELLGAGVDTKEDLIKAELALAKLN